MFVYIHFNVPPTRITEMYQMKRFIDMEQSHLSMLLLSSTLCSVFQLMNTPLITFRIMIRDFSISISFSRVIIVQDFRTVTFYVLFGYKPTFSVIFC